MNLLKQLYNSSLLRSFGAYTSFTMLNLAVPFFMMPVLTRYLTPTDYGVVSMFGVLLGISGPFVGLTIHGAVSVKYFDKTETDLPKYIGNCFFLLFISSTIVSLIIWLFAYPISSVSAFPQNWLWTVIFISVGQFVILMLMTLWQVQEKPFRYGVLQISRTLVEVSLIVFLVVVMSKNWQGRIEAQLLTTFFFASFSFLLLYKYKWLKFNYDWSYLKNALKFGIPLIPHTLGGLLITQTDRILITNMVSIQDTGIYSVGFQIATIINLLAASFNSAYVPWLYKRLGEDNPETKIRIVKFTYIYFVVIIVLAIGLSLFAPWFLSFYVGEKFAGAYKYTAWIALSFSFNGMYYMVANYIFYAAKTYLLAWVTFFTALVNIGFTYALIRMNGAIGAAQASALAFFISFILTWLLSARVYDMPWGLKKLIGKGNEAH